MRRVFASYRAAYSGLPRETWLLAAVALINRVGTMVLPFLILWLTAQRGMSADDAGGLVGCYGVGAMIGAWLGGRLADAVGATRVVVASLALSAVAFLILGELRSSTEIAFCLLGAGVVAEAFRPANVALLAATCPVERRTQAFALLRLAVNLGMAVGPVIGGFIAVVDYAWLFRVDAATCLCAAVVFGVAFRGWRPAPATDDGGVNSANGSPWRDPIMLAAMLLGLLVVMAFLQMLSTLPLYLREGYGFDERMIGVLFAINPVLIVLIEMPLVHRLRDAAPLRVIAAGSACLALSYAVLPLGAGFAFAALFVIIWTIGEMLESAQMHGFVASRSGDHNRGRYMGLYMFMFATGFVLAPIVGTRVYAAAGPTVLWFGCAGAAVVAALGFVALSRAVDAKRRARGTSSSVPARLR